MGQTVFASDLSLAAYLGDLSSHEIMDKEQETKLFFVIQKGIRTIKEVFAQMNTENQEILLIKQFLKKQKRRKKKKEFVFQQINS